MRSVKCCAEKAAAAMSYYTINYERTSLHYAGAERVCARLLLSRIIRGRAREHRVKFEHDARFCFACLDRRE